MSVFERLGAQGVFGLTFGPEWTAALLVAAVVAISMPVLWLNIQRSGSNDIGRIMKLALTSLGVAGFSFAVVLVVATVTIRMSRSVRRTIGRTEFLLAELRSSSRAMKDQIGEDNVRYSRLERAIDDFGLPTVPNQPWTDSKSAFVERFNNAICDGGEFPGGLDHATALGITNSAERQRIGCEPEYNEDKRWGDLLAIRWNNPGKGLADTYYMVPIADPNKWNNTRAISSAWDFWFQIGEAPQHRLKEPAIAMFRRGKWTRVTRGAIDLKV
jgi:hypothetical protein